MNGGDSSAASQFLGAVLAPPGPLLEPLVISARDLLESPRMVAVHHLSSPDISPRVFRILYGGQLLGFLGSRPGLFESAEGASEPGPPACQFRSVTAEWETAILELLHTANSFDGLIEVLERAGLQLQETNPSGVFTPSSVVFRAVIPLSE